MNLDGDVWTRLGRLPNQPRVDWMHPIDLSSRVAGNHRFWLRLVYEVPPSGSHESGAASAPQSLVLRRIRFDSEVQGPGRLRTWRNGANEIRSIPAIQAIASAGTLAERTEKNSKIARRRSSLFGLQNPEKR